MEKWIKEAQARQAQMVADRRALHQMPEYGFEMDKTYAYVKARLEEMGFAPRACGKKGLVVVLGEGEPCILLRADMDGLPVPELAELPFKAENGYGHLCGHDMHVSMLLAAADMLKAHEAELPGQVKLMFQPAEELGAGAKDMIADGLLENPKVMAAAALHVQSVKPVGWSAYKPGVATSSIDSYMITIQGKGGHSSAPENAINPLDVAGYIQMLLNSAVQREISCQENAVLAVTQIHGGEVLNAFPETAQICGNTRCYSNRVREYLFRRIQEVAEGVCALFHATCRIEWIRTPLIEVDPALCELFVPALKEVFEQVEVAAKPFSGSEDFSYLSEADIPVFFGWLGAGHEGNFALHNPNVTFDEEAMWRGAATLAGMAETWLQAQK